jgi:hypothetical protein
MRGRSGDRADLLVLFGHGNHEGFAVGGGALEGWQDMALRFAPWRPTVLLPVSCFGALASVRATWWQSVPSLQWILGAPTTLRTDQALLATVGALARARGVAVSSEASAMAFFANLLTTGGVVAPYSRQWDQARTPFELVGADLLSILAQAYAAPPPRPPTRRSRRGPGQLHGRYHRRAVRSASRSL